MNQQDEGRAVEQEAALERGGRAVSISVRDLVAFVWREGGLSRPSERSLSNRAVRGTRGHQELQRKRPANYLPEVSIRYVHYHNDFRLSVFGRIDGIFEGEEPLVVEEIKTVTRSWDGQADPLHRAQLRFYAAVLARRRDLSAVNTQLTYYNLDTRVVKTFEQTEERAALDRFLNQTLEVYGEWLADYLAWCGIRDQSLSGLRFPFDPLRRGQDEVVGSVRQAISDGKRLYMEAATGLGKTLGVLYPAVQAFQSGGADRCFYLSAKNTGKEATAKALEILRQQGVRLRSLNLQSKTSTCIRDGKACDPGVCPLATNYYQNQKRAMREALTHDALDYSLLSDIGETHQVCPFELALDVSSFVDVVICDYNYIFDSQATLNRAFQPSPGRFIGLVDECHNLVERGRELYSARLGLREASELRREIGSRSPGLRRGLAVFQNLFDASANGEAFEVPDNAEQGSLFHGFDLPRDASKKSEPTSWRQGVVEVGVPEEVVNALSYVLSEIENWFAAGIEASFNETLLSFYFDLTQFSKLSEYERSLFRFYLESGKEPAIKLLCVDPASLLRQSMDVFASTICFSGTLSPVALFRTLLGGDSDDPCLRIESPFDRDQLRLEIDTRIDTRLRNRKGSEPALVERIVRTISREPGSYLVFFSSYEYLQNVLSAVHNHYEMRGSRVRGDGPDAENRVTKADEDLRRFTVGLLKDSCEDKLEKGALVEWVWQVPGMSEEARNRLVRNISCSEYGTVVTFAVLGGLFGEAVDIPNNCLKGVIVVGVGYPKISREREMVAAHFDESLAQGFEVAYLVPGMNRVVQAAGRLIRNETDRGSIVLIDSRYQGSIYRALLPSWWGLA